LEGIMPGADAQLLADLLNRHGAALKLFARQWCTTPDDVVQQAFIELMSCAMLPDSPVAWLFAVVKRRAISKARADRTRGQRESAAAESWFERLRDQQEAAIAAAEALAELPVADREVVVAHLYGRLTFEEIGNLTGASSSSAQRRYEAALNRLRERIGVPCPKTKT
jgi:RNA polymerase sigma factor (sigma-70 family)